MNTKLEAVNTGHRVMGSLLGQVALLISNWKLSTPGMCDGKPTRAGSSMNIKLEAVNTGHRVIGSLLGQLAL